MYWLFTAFRRLCRSFSFVLTLIILAAAVTASAALGDSAEARPCGLVCEDTGAEAAEVSAMLMDCGGFVTCRDRDELFSRLASGEVDCGAVILTGLGEKLRSGDPESAVLLFNTAASLLTDLYSGCVGAAVFCTYAPYITHTALLSVEADADFETVKAEYDKALAQGAGFTFDITTARGAAISPKTGYASGMMQAACALLLFASAAAAVSGGGGKEAAAMGRLIGTGKYTACVLLPNMAAQLILSTAAVCIGALGARIIFGAEAVPDMLRDIILPAGLYALVLAAFTAAVSQAVPAVWITAASPFLLLAGAALCPVFTDVTKAVPAAEYAGYAVPPSWFYIFRDEPVFALVAAAVFASAACGIVYIRTKFSLKGQ